MFDVLVISALAVVLVLGGTRLHSVAVVGRTRNGEIQGRLEAVSDCLSIPDAFITDEELTELALSADPEAPLPDDAVPIAIHLVQCIPALPSWYMPPVVRSGSGRRWKAPVVLAIVSAFLLIDALGLCNTYGILSLG